MKNSTPKIICPPVWIVVTVLLALLLGGGIYYRGDANEKAVKRNAGLVTQLRARQAESAKLAIPYSDDMATEAAARAQRFRESLLSMKELVALLDASTGPAWQRNGDTQDVTSEYVRTSLTLVRAPGSPVSEWANILELTRKLQGTPGLVVDSIDIAAIGDNQRRIFQRVSLRITAYLQRPVEAEVGAVTSGRPVLFR